MPVVRTFTAADLTRYSGVYRAGAGEWLFGGCAMFVMGLMFFCLAQVFGAKLGITLWISTPLAVLAGAAAIAVVIVEIRATIVIAANGVHYISPWARLSWFVPSHEIVRCELVSRKAKVLSLVTERGPYSVLLTAEMWTLIREPSQAAPTAETSAASSAR